MDIKQKRKDIILMTCLRYKDCFKGFNELSIGGLPIVLTLQPL